MEDIWFVSDPHFGHKNIIQYSNRPFADVDEMNEKMVENWNALVKPGDRVYCNGDVAFMPYDKFRAFIWRLNGNIHLVLGNHDKMISEHKNDLLKQGKFATIQHYNELKVAGETIILFHYGMRTWNKAHRGSILCYGHSHGSLPPFGRSVDVGVDCKEITSDYRPIHLDELLAYMKKREPEIVDHHGKRGDEDG
jgi:calcineurin-like phosphoesterase family protein